MIISCWILTRMISFWDERCKKKSQHTFYIKWFFSRNRAIYEIMWRNMVRTREASGDNVVHVFSCWLTKATNTHSQYVILIAIPLQQWLWEHALMVHYIYCACLVTILFRWMWFSLQRVIRYSCCMFNPIKLFCELWGSCGCCQSFTYSEMWCCVIG